MAEPGVWEFWLGLPWGDAAGHISYLIIAVSYWLTNIYWLRVTAVIGLCLEIAYFVLVSGATLYTGIGWDLDVHRHQPLPSAAPHARAPARALGRLTTATCCARCSTASTMRRSACCSAAASWHKAPVGEQLTTEGAPVPALMLIAAGQVSVDVGDRTIARMGPGSFIGEMAFLSGGTASATVTVTHPTRVMKIEQARLKTLLVIDSQIAAVLHRLLGADLAQKLRTRNEAA